MGGDGGRGDWWATGTWEASTGAACGTRRLIRGTGDKWEALADPSQPADDALEVVAVVVSERCSHQSLCAFPIDSARKP
ncbi:hypothetical protein Scep_024559 [Stephania cephalantha]|uniref:Uncharacterized protein n=1 Tax=Stephania cephalantha TaxID=152367 RepID=A0AAP0HYM1_9MAGN